MEEPIRDKLERDARMREPYSFQHRQLRWAVLKELATHSPELRRATSTLAADYKLPLGLYFFDIEETLSKLKEAEDLPERLRPPKEWKNTNWAGYLLGLGRVCVWFGLLSPLSWVFYAGWQEPMWLRTPRSSKPPLWVETLHYFLQEQHRGSLEKEVHGSLYQFEIPLPLPYPWLKQPPRRRGRPALDASGQRWQELEALARCIAQRLLGQSWEEIADTCGLTTRRGFDLTPLEVATRCRRLAKRLQIYRPL